MLFNTAILAAMAAPILVFAQDSSDKPNPFKWNDGGIMPAAGESTTLSWTPTTDGTVTLILRSGASSDLNEGTVIASNVDNSGSYTWDVDSDITRGSDYTVEIVDDDDEGNVNYSPYFVLESDNTVASSTGQVTLGAPTASSVLTASMATTSGTSTEDDDSMTTSMPSSSDASATTETETNTETTTTGESSSMPTTGSSTMMTTTTSGSSSDTTESPTQSDLQASSTPSEGSGARATAVAGMLGVVALGAMAL